jgi:hypothetical protein
MLMSCFSLTGRRFFSLSATGFAGVTATSLVFGDFNPVVPEDEIDFTVEGHGGRHIGEKSR